MFGFVADMIADGIYPFVLNPTDFFDLQDWGPNAIAVPDYEITKLSTCDDDEKELLIHISTVQFDRITDFLRDHLEAEVDLVKPDGTLDGNVLKVYHSHYEKLVSLRATILFLKS